MTSVIWALVLGSLLGCGDSEDPNQGAGSAAGGGSQSVGEELDAEACYTSCRNSCPSEYDPACIMMRSCLSECWDTHPDECAPPAGGGVITCQCLTDCQAARDPIQEACDAQARANALSCACSCLEQCDCAYIEGSAVMAFGNTCGDTANSDSIDVSDPITASTYLSECDAYAQASTDNAGAGGTGGSGMAGNGSAGSDGIDPDLASLSVAELCARVCEIAAPLGCPNDANCAQRCASGATVFQACASETRALLECGASRAVSDYECDADGESYTKDGVCAPEGDALTACLLAN